MKVLIRLGVILSILAAVLFVTPNTARATWTGFRYQDSPYPSGTYGYGVNNAPHVTRWDMSCDVNTCTMNVWMNNGGTSTTVQKSYRVAITPAGSLDPPGFSFVDEWTGLDQYTCGQYTCSHDTNSPQGDPDGTGYLRCMYPYGPTYPPTYVCPQNYPVTGGYNGAYASWLSIGTVYDAEQFRQQVTFNNDACYSPRVIVSAGGYLNQKTYTWSNANC